MFAAEHRGGANWARKTVKATLLAVSAELKAVGNDGTCKHERERQPSYLGIKQQ